MTYRQKCEARKARQAHAHKIISAKHLARKMNFAARVEREIAKRPPRIEWRSATPEIVYSDRAGPATSFAVGHRIENDPSFGPDLRRRYSRHTIGEIPKQRQIQVWITPNMANWRLGDGSQITHTPRSETIVLRAVRMRMTVERMHQVDRIDWFTWEPVGENKAYPAVCEARAIFDRLVQTLQFDFFTAQASSDDKEILRGMVWRLLRHLEEARALVEPLRNAADEWLQTPTAEAVPTPERESRSRW